MSLAKEMLEYRAKMNLSQEKAALMAGITLQTWNQVEREMQNPSRLTEEKIRQLIRKEE